MQVLLSEIDLSAKTSGKLFLKTKFNTYVLRKYNLKMIDVPKKPNLVASFFMKVRLFCDTIDHL